MNSTRIARWSLYFLIAIVVAVIIWSYNDNVTSREILPVTQLAQQIRNNEIAELVVVGDGREITIRDTFVFPFFSIAGSEIERHYDANTP